MKDHDQSSSGGSSDRYLMTFTRTADTMLVYERVKQVFPGAVLLPVPHQISRSCGLAIQFPDGDAAGNLRFYSLLTVPADLYRLRMIQDPQGVNHILAVEAVS